MTVVLKFGGAAVATPEQFHDIAEIVIQRKEDYGRVIIVVSAMANSTDRLIELAKRVSNNPPQREYDMLISAGERISMSLLAMALADRGLDAISFTGSQSGIITCENHSDAKVIEVRPYRILRALDQGKIVIVAGFQGVSREGEVTTLGRGGSDVSAVALGAALDAEHVEFFKDVGGVYDSDPKLNGSAKLLENLSYDEAMEIANRGAQVLNKRCIALAKKSGVSLRVCSFIDVCSASYIK